MYISINDLDVEKIVQKSLVESLGVIENLNDKEDVPLYDAINQVLAYYSTPDQLRDLAHRNVPNSWADTVLAYDEEKNQEKLKKGMDMVKEIFPQIKGVGFIV